MVEITRFWCKQTKHHRCEKRQKDNKQAGDHFHGCDRISGLTIDMQVARQLDEIVLIYSKSHGKQAGVCLF